MNTTTPPEAESDARFGRALLVLTLGAFLVRALYLLLEPRCELTGDENSWIALGVHELGRPRRGLSPLRNPFIFYPPVYPYFIAVLHRIFGTLAAVQWAQAALGSLIVPAVGRAGRLAFGARVGLLAAAFATVYPDLVWFSVHFWAETVFVVLLWWAFERLLEADARTSVRWTVVAGLLWGLATLSELVVMYGAGRLVAWLGETRVLTLSLALAVVRWGILATTGAMPAVAAAQVLHAFTFGTFHVAAIQFTYDAFPRPLRASGQSLYSLSSFGIGMILGFGGSGLFYDLIGPRGLFAASCALAAIAAVASLWLSDAPAEETCPVS